jgi:hypothetical protein
MTTKLLTGGALAALAAALAFTAAPASAQDWHDNGRDRGAQQQNHGNHGGDRHEDRGQSARGGGNNGAQAQRPYTPQGNANRGQWNQSRGEQRVQAAPRTTQAVPGWGDGPRATRTERNRTYVDQSRNRTYVDRDRDNSYRGVRPENNRVYRNTRGNYRQWNRGWRNDNRYDWQRYRGSNRNIYHLRPYYAPYRSYSYRRLGIGFYLDPLFFGQDYWIGDPGYYRLPAVYGPYRWVRYYDDALLVNIYTGEVADVIYDFFW